MRSTLYLLAFATFALLATVGSARAADSPGNSSFHADQYPSPGAAIVDLARQVAGELRSRPAAPKEIRVRSSNSVDEALRQQFIDRIERELPGVRCATAGGDATTGESTGETRVTLAGSDPAPIASPWTQDDRQFQSGSFTATVESNGFRATLVGQYVEKPWADDWAGFVNANSSSRWLIGRSESPAISEADATDAARRAVADDLTNLVRDQMNARAERSAAPRVSVSRAWLREQVLSSLRRNASDDGGPPHPAPRIVAENRNGEVAIGAPVREAEITGETAGDTLVRDIFVQRFNRPYGDVWLASVLVDASPKVIDRLADTYTAAARATQASRARSWAGAGGMVAVIVLLYFFLNAMTRGYFMWRLRAVALLVAIAGVLLVFVRIGYP